MINVTLTFSGIPEVLEFFSTLGAPATAVKVETAPTPKPEAPTPTKSKKSAPAPAPVDAPAPPTAPPTAAPAPAAAVDLTPEPEPAAPAIDYAVLQKAVLALYSRDRGAAQAICNGLGHATFKTVPQEKWAEALEQVNAALGA